MSRILRHCILILSGIMLFTAVPAYSQLIHMPVDSVVSRVIRARGGIKRIESINSLKMEGIIKIRNTDASLIMDIKRPGKVRMEAAVGSDTLIQAYDGVTAWAVIPQQGETIPQRLPASQEAELKRQADMDGPLIHSAQKGITVAFADTAKGPDGLEYRLKLTSKNGSESYLYIDADTYHTVKETSLRKIRTKSSGTPNQVVNIVLKYSDYQSVGGVVFPFQIATYLNGSMISDMALRKIIINPSLPDSLFTFPASNK